VASGRGVAFVPESARLLGIAGVSYLDLAGAAGNEVELHVVWLRTSRNPALHRLLAELTLAAD